MSFTFVSLILFYNHLNHKQKYKRFSNIFYHSYCSFTVVFWVMNSINLFGTFICKTELNTVSLHHIHTTLVCWRDWHSMPDSLCNIWKQLKLGTWTLKYDVRNNNRTVGKILRLPSQHYSFTNSQDMRNALLWSRAYTLPSGVLEVALYFKIHQMLL